MPSLSRDGTRQLELSDEQFGELAEELENYRRLCASPLVALSDTAGLLLAKSGKAKDKALVLLSALAAANFSASFQMAKLVGERTGFIAQCYEGARFSIYMHEVPDDYLLVTVFGKNSPLSIVQHFAARYSPRMQQILWRNNSDENFTRRSKQIKEEISKREFEDELTQKLSQVLTR